MRVAKTRILTQNRLSPKMAIFLRANGHQNYFTMRTLIVLILWCFLFMCCWPLALLVIVLFPLVWLILLPFKFVAFTLEAVFKLVGAILLFPFKLIRAI